MLERVPPQFRELQESRLRIDATEVSMPTQIPAVRSTVPSAIDVLMLSLLAATINAIIVLIILWAYS